jgi:hypothetical protein
MKKHIVIRILGVVLTLASVLFFLPAHTVIAAKSAQWTVAFYMDSDNDLDSWAQKDVNELMTVGSTSDVNVVLYWDTSTGPGHMYKVYRNSLSKLTGFEYDNVEPNMGDPKTLHSFLSYVTKNFPANKYALVLWDHGDDFRGLLFDEHIPGPGFDLLSNQELVRAMSGFRIDTMIDAACVMSQIDVAYEYAVGALNVNYLVATEGYDTMNSFPFDWVLSSLVSHPSMTPLEFSKMAVDQYICLYSTTGKANSQAVTMSVVQIDAADELGNAVLRLASCLQQDISGYAAIISSARGQANLPWSENGWDRLVDLKTFVQSVHDQSLNPRAVREIDSTIVSSVINSANTALACIPSTVLYSGSVKAMSKHGVGGIGVFFPTSQSSFENSLGMYSDIYASMAFSKAGWLNFLYAYYGASAE